MATIIKKQKTRKRVKKNPAPVLGIAFLISLLLLSATIFMLAVSTVELIQVQRQNQTFIVERGATTQALNQMGVRVQELESDLYLFPIHPEDVTGKFTSAFGVRNNPLIEGIGGEDFNEHNGIDVVGRPKARIIAIADGVVEDHWYPAGYHYGRWFRGHPVFDGYIVIRHDDGRKSEYGHLSETMVHMGQRVEAGDIIGRQGNGGISTGEHLHFGLQNMIGEYVQPLNYIKY